MDMNMNMNMNIPTSIQHSSNNTIVSTSCHSTISNTIIDDIALSFTDVTIREYEIVPGMNPSCSDGPPVEVGWQYSHHSIMDIDHYESIRNGSRRYNLQMKMPTLVRKDMLLLHGCTEKMIRDATRKNQKCRQRMKRRIETFGGVTRRRRIGSSSSSSSPSGMGRGG